MLQTGFFSLFGYPFCICVGTSATLVTGFCNISLKMKLLPVVGERYQMGVKYNYVINLCF